jgi:hypothetical protein
VAAGGTESSKRTVNGTTRYQEITSTFSETAIGAARLAENCMKPQDGIANQYGDSYMADVTTDEQGRTYKNGVLQTSTASSPGVGGAIKDAIAALSKSFAPRSIVDRPKVVQGTVDANSLGNQF